MGITDEMIRNYKRASCRAFYKEGEEAENEGRLWSWLIRKIIVKIIVNILIFPARFVWRWTEERTNGFVMHIIQFAFFTFLAYAIPILVIVEMVKKVFS